jgi:heat shock protein HslJ
MKWSTLSFLPTIFILVLFLAHPAQSAMAFTGQTWQVADIGGLPVAAGEPNRLPHLLFSAEGRISGSTGCNRLAGTYQLDGNALKFSPLAMTKMACPPPLDAQERAFIQAMNATASVRHTGHTLELLDAGGKVQMLLQAR